jgi:hypothetical protein
VLNLIDVIVLIIPLIVGIQAGYFLRDRKQVNLNKVTYGAIVVLIFSLGFSIGSDNELLESMPRVGLNALVILLLAILFSVICMKIGTKMAGLK